MGDAGRVVGQHLAGFVRPPLTPLTPLTPRRRIGAVRSAVPTSPRVRSPTADRGRECGRNRSNSGALCTLASPHAAPPGPGAPRATAPPALSSRGRLRRRIDFNLCPLPSRAVVCGADPPELHPVLPHPLHRESPVRRACRSLLRCHLTPEMTGGAEPAVAFGDCLSKLRSLFGPRTGWVDYAGNTHLHRNLLGSETVPLVPRYRRPSDMQ